VEVAGHQDELAEQPPDSTTVELLEFRVAAHPLCPPSAPLTSAEINMPQATRRLHSGRTDGGTSWGLDQADAAAVLEGLVVWQ
jgi:hypothetical protein